MCSSSKATSPAQRGSWPSTGSVPGTSSNDSIIVSISTKRSSLTTRRSCPREELVEPRRPVLHGWLVAKPEADGEAVDCGAGGVPREVLGDIGHGRSSG